MSDLPPYVETLNDVLTRKAAEWTKGDLETIVSALREQRDRWNAEQNLGSGKRITAKKIETGRDKPIKAGSLKLAIKGLKL